MHCVGHRYGYILKIHLRSAITHIGVNNDNSRVLISRVIGSNPINFELIRKHMHFCLNQSVTRKENIQKVCLLVVAVPLAKLEYRKLETADFQ